MSVEWVSVDEMRKEMATELIRLQDTDEFSTLLGRILLSIANMAANSSIYKGFNRSWKEEMVGEALINEVDGLDKWDRNAKRNPFSWFYQRALWGIQNFLKGEERLSKKKEQYIEVRKVRSRRVGERIWYKNWRDDDVQEGHD